MDAYKVVQIIKSIKNKDINLFDDKQRGLNEIYNVIKNGGTYDDPESGLYLTQFAYNRIRALCKLYSLTAKDLQKGLPGYGYLFNEGMYSSVCDSVKDNDPMTYEDAIKDANHTPVDKVIPLTQNYIALQSTTSDGHQYFLVVGKDKYHGEKDYLGGGTVTFSLREAKEDAEHYEIMNHLDKKYGKVEGYKRYIRGEVDSVKDANNIFGITYRANGVFQRVLVKANSSREAIDKFEKEEKRIGEVAEDITVSASPLDDREIEDYKRRGISIIDSDIDYLTEEEQKAVDDYKKAIARTNDIKLLRLYQHILGEELEHIEELQESKAEDSIKDDSFVWVIRNEQVLIIRNGQVIQRFSDIESAQDAGWELKESNYRK